LALETFTWEPDGDPAAEVVLRAREAKLGDGYVQVAGDGLNPESDSWDVEFGGPLDEMLEIRAFIKRHGGYKAFLWTNPDGELGLYRCKEYRWRRQPVDLATVSATFERAFHP